MTKYVAVGLIVCVILGFLGYVQPALAQETEESKTEALLKYQAQKKNPWIGVGAAWLIPTLGHAYAGNWKRGAKFLLIDLGCIVLMGAGAKQYVETGSSGLYTIGYLGLIASRIWEFVDAYKAVEDYNKRLAEKYGIKFSLNFMQNNLPMNEKNVIQVALSYEF